MANRAHRPWPVGYTGHWGVPFRTDPTSKRQQQLKDAIAICAYIRDYILTVNPANIPPYRRLISGELLITCYEKTKKKVVPRIASESFLNFTTDETVMT